MLAHLSDLHVLAPRRARASLDLTMRFVSFGRALDPEGRRRKLARALTSARQIGATDIVITGDLTEVGIPDQFEELAAILHDSCISPDRIILVPGNHDAYTSPDAWHRALEGPLAAFRPTAAEEPGKIVETCGVLVMPIDTTFYHSVFRSAGMLGADGVRLLASRLASRDVRDRQVVLGMHHTPIPHASRAWQWIDGLGGHEPVLDLLRRFENVEVLHGHLHYDVARSIDGGRPRVFGATAVVEDPPEASRVRLHGASRNVEPSRQGQSLAAA
jgi:3',5'-cyclic AMP phosphodiesterase CpdA